MAQPKPDSVRVWDRLVRGGHWGSLLLIVIALNTHGGLLTLHRSAGYALLALLGWRIAWGFVGTGHARFADFVPSWARLARYLGQMLRGCEPRMLGHNPAGALMVLALIATLLAIVATGLLLDTTSFRDHRPLHAWHDGLSDALLVLASLHVLGVVYTSLRHRENLIWAMVTGRKRPTPAGSADARRL